jgi:DNA sulfur modification protein DndD
MTDEIRIISIEIENYRQYYGKQIVEFPDRDNGFSVIVGDNGAGKSNILNAINWCFYLKEPHKSKNTGNYIINKKYFEELENGHIGMMAIKIKLKKNNDEYHISRILSVVKNEFQYEEREDGKVLNISEVEGYFLPTGSEVLSSESSFKIMVKEKGFKEFHPIETVRSDTLMNEILPALLAPYFLLDGEYLEKFWEDLSRVKTGVESISQLNLLSTASEHLSKMKSSVPVIGSSQIDRLTKDIKNLERYENSLDINGNEQWSKLERYGYDPSSGTSEYYHASGYPKIDELDKDIQKMKLRLNEITKEFSESNIEMVKRLNKELQTTTKAFDGMKSQLEQAKKLFIHAQIHYGPIFFLKNSFKKVVDFVEELRIKGELPYESKMIFTKDLLDLGKCICHADLKSKKDKKGNETNESRINVEKVRAAMANDQGLDYALKMVNSFNEKILRDPVKFITKSFESPEKNYYGLKKQFKNIVADLGEVKRKLLDIGDTNVDKLTEDHDYVVNLIEESTKTIGEINDKIHDNHRDIRDFKSDRTTLMNKDDKSKRIAFDQNVWENISKILDETLNSLKKEIRLDVQKRTFEIFEDTMYKQKVWDRFIIKENYTAELIDNRNVPSLGSLSAGEKLFLALSFISALKEITGYRFPLVIDTPLGRVSGKSRYLLSQALPRYLPNDQLLFLATGTEILEPILNWNDDPEGFPEKSFAELLEESVKMNYWSLNPDDSMTTINKFIPKWRKNESG